MPCHYNENDRVQYIEKRIEIDKPETLRMLARMEKLLCNAGFIIRNNPKIKADKTEIKEILDWHEQHRVEEVLVHLKENKRIYNEMLNNVKAIERLGGKPTQKKINELKKAKAMIENLQKKIRSKDEELLYSRNDDCLIKYQIK